MKALSNINRNVYDHSSGGGGIPEAPRDGKVYGRSDATWKDIDGSSGKNGSTFTPIPTVTGSTLNLSWSNDGGLPNPTPVDVIAPKGDAGTNGTNGTNGTDGSDATINGVNTLTIVEGDNITLEQVGNTLTINSTGGTKKYIQSFVDLDLTDNAIVITHNLNSEYVIASVYDSNKRRVIIDEIIIIDENSIKLEMPSFTPLVDTYTIVIV